MKLQPPIAALVLTLSASLLVSLLSLPANGTGAAASDATASAPLRLNAAAIAAHQAGEPSLGEIFRHLGYSTDPTGDEVSAQRFMKAHRGPVIFRPIAAFGLPKTCTGGWYLPTNGRPLSTQIWQVGPTNNKRYSPPVVQGGHTRFNPGSQPFGLWVSTAGFKDEVVCSQDDLQRFVPRFKANDRHKAHVFRAEKNGRVIPDTYLIGWEYSTNDDDQDMVTLVSNVRPATP